MCHAKSMAAIKRGVQEVVFRLGRVPRYHQTDNSTSATHQLNNATLLGLAAALPTDRHSFLAVKGTGETRWECFGAKVVEICLMARAAGHQPLAPAPRVRKARGERR